MISPDMMTLDTTVSTETPMIIDEEIPTTIMTILDDSSDDKDDTLDGTIDDTIDDTLDDKDDTFDDTMDTTMEPESSMLPKEMIDVTTMSTNTITSSNLSCMYVTTTISLRPNHFTSSVTIYSTTSS